MKTKKIFDLMFYHQGVSLIQALNELSLEHVMAKAEKLTSPVTAYQVQKLAGVTKDDGELIQVDVQVNLL